MAGTQSSPLSKARALQGASQAVEWDFGTVGALWDSGGAWAHQGLQVPESRGSSMQRPEGLTAERVLGVALGDVEHGGAQRPL